MATDRIDAARVQDLGALTGDVLLFGGAYSNLQATEAMLAEAESLGIPVENRIFTGDAIAYCGNPLQTWDLVAREAAVCVAGNCERQLETDAADCGCGFEEGSTCDALSDGWYGFARARVAGDKDLQAAFAACPDMAVFSHHGLRYVVIHGGATDRARFLWPASTPSDFTQEIDAIQSMIGPVDGVISGHSGIAFERQIGRVHWINAGAIGMPPHDGRPMTRYAVLSDDDVRIHRLSYDATAARQAMEAAGLIQGYHLSLTTGVWPSEDVLPVALRRA